MIPILLDLPWPPSVNSYWRHPSSGPLAGRHLISAEGRAYREAARLAMIEQLQRQPRLRQRLDVTIQVAPPDRRQRDLDNLPKAIFDSLTHAGLWMDDSQIDALQVIRREPTPGGRVILVIREADPLEAMPNAA